MIRKLILLCVFFIACPVVAAHKAAADDTGSSLQVAHHSALVQQFLKAGNKQQLLLQAYEALARQRALRDELRKKFVAQKSELDRLNKKVRSGEGELGEFVGTERATAQFFVENVKSSIIYTQDPSVLKVARKLAVSSQLPYRHQVIEFAREMLQVMSLQGAVARYETTVVMRHGREKKTAVVRVGPFNVIGKGMYLQYLPGYDALVVPPSQPGIKYQLSARHLFEAKHGLTGFGVDLTRGGLTGN